MGILGKILRVLLDDSESKPENTVSASEGLNVEEEIRQHENIKCTINDTLSDLRDEIKKKVAGLRRLIAERDHSDNSYDKDILAEQIRDLYAELESMKNDLKAYRRQLNVETETIKQLRLIRIHDKTKFDKEKLKAIIRRAEMTVGKIEQEDDLLQELKEIQYPEQEDHAPGSQVDDDKKREEEINEISAKINPSPETRETKSEVPADDSEEFDDIKKKINSL